MLEITVNKKTAELLSKGFPWILKNQLIGRNSALDLADPGELCAIITEKGKKLGMGYFNPGTQISARVLTMNPSQKINSDFFKEKFTAAIKRRRKNFHENYFRAVYGEADQLPGLIVDLYGEYAVAQVNSAGMENLQDHWLPALIDAMHLKGVFLDGTSKHRTREGIGLRSELLFGEIPEIVEVRENNLTYYADVVNGQKTGWFYDQRKNRHMLSMIASGKSVLDLYTHSGGFGLLCANNNASEVVMVDSSDLALSLAEQASRKNELNNCYFIRSDVFGYLDATKKHNKQFAIVNADPPAFIKSRHDITVGLKGYEKLTKKCVELVSRGGVFAISSCSYFARPDIFRAAIENALKHTGREFELLFKLGADKDHPIHPMLAETNYLKFLVYRLD